MTLTYFRYASNHSNMVNFSSDNCLSFGAKSFKNKTGHRQGHLFLFKKVYLFCGIYCRIIPKSGSSNVFVLKIKDDFGFQNIVFVRYSNEKDNIQTGLLWTNGVI